MKKFLLSSVLFLSVVANAQHAFMTKEDNWKKKYRAFATKHHNLVHTKLQAKFDYEKAQLIGKVWLTLKPHFYPTSLLELDAKGMEINSVEIVKGKQNVALSYDYNDNNVLKITLDKEYTNKEPYTIYIDYIAKPNELESKGSAAIKDAKGLYFINPKGEEKDKPTQIWTQGETEATSVWVPTIDKPNQKSTQEFYLTVPSKYVSLSNGKLMSQTKNTDGTRTDYWKMDLPHAPYLFFMGVGDFAIVKDVYKGKEVNYYVEKEYEKVAKKIFGLTPEMMKFFGETVTGIDFPWNKYAQIVGRDYVSGAMENTTATLHQESAYQNARQLVDGNEWETTIAHELFHQWFGDYVTAESWSNLTVNESFANYSEYLWMEYKYGADAAADENESAMRAYMSRNSESKKDLVRFYYADKEDMFDVVSYQKGGRILNMLRNYVGDSAFFKSLNRYLTDNKFGTGNAHKLRLAFETVTGKDLNWFFNQWYFGSSHPKLKINYSYDATNKKAMVIVAQAQDSTKTFKFPTTIDMYIGNEKTRKEVWVENKNDTFTIDAATEPSFITLDGDRVLLCDKKENKNIFNYAIQYKKGKYSDRKDAIDFAIKNINTSLGMEILKMATNDNYYKLRIKAISALQDTTVDAETISKIEVLANTDGKKRVRAAAINFLGNLRNTKYATMFKTATKDSSYSVAGAALEALMLIDEAASLQLVDDLKKDAEGDLKTAVAKVEILKKTDADFAEINKKFNAKSPMEKFEDFENYAFFIGRLNNMDNFKSGIDNLIKFRDMVSSFGAGLKDLLNKPIKDIKKKKQSENKSTSMEQAKYIEDKLSEE
jgi:aminopeptidase N